MKRRVLLIAMCFLIFFSLNFFSASQTKISWDEKFENKELIRVVISLKNSSLKTPELDSLNTAKTFQKDVLLSKEKIKYQDSESIIAFISSDDLISLQQNSLVDSIYPEIYLNTFLEDSLELQNVTPSWNLQLKGTNLTGVGQTVCIIDTGVDYNHPSLGGCYGNNDPFSNCKVIGGWDFCADDINCLTQDNDPMDVNGHGTHVSGIVSSNKTLLGVAPGTKIVMIKASNSTGSFALSDLNKGLEWCINNATKFNISVISLSLGGGYWSESSCDSFIGPGSSEFNDIVTLFQEANEKNISITVASGNSYSNYPTKISFPACISFAIPVSATTINDALASYSNRNSLVKLVAVGSSVDSTWLNGNFATASGTSMATPMVAGSIAMINQYLSFSKTTKNSSQIEEMLYQNGKIISEGIINYSRINLYPIFFSDSPTLQVNDTLESETINFSLNYFSFLDLELNLFCYNNLTNKSLNHSLLITLNNSEESFNYSYNFSSLGLEYCNLTVTDLFNRTVSWSSYYDSNQDGIIGGLENINTSLENLNVSLTSSNVSFILNNFSLIFFEYNFSISPLNFDSIQIDSQLPGSSFSYLFVSGLNLTLQNKTKTFYLDRILNGAGICIKDSLISNISEISSNCNGEYEFFVSCPGINGNYSCELLSEGKYKISGLNHTGVKEITTYCGDGTCNGDETCSSCSSDCGSCPPVVTSSSKSTSKISSPIEIPIILENKTYTLEYFNEEDLISNDTNSSFQTPLDSSSKTFGFLFIFILLVLVIFFIILYFESKNDQKNTSTLV